MSEIFEWIKKMIYLSVFLTMLLQILPGSAYRKYVRFFAGLIFVITITAPLAKILHLENIGEEKLEEILAAEEQKEVSLDFPYMEAQQKKYYEKNMQAAAEEVVRAALGEMGADVSDIRVECGDEDGTIEKVSLETGEMEASEAGRLQKKVAELLDIGLHQVEVK